MMESHPGFSLTTAATTAASAAAAAASATPPPPAQAAGRGVHPPHTLHPRRRRRRTPRTHAAGTFCWLQLETPEVEAAAEFYREVYGWQTDATRGAERAAFFAEGAVVAGISRGQSGAPAQFSPFLAVDDVDAGVAQAVALGAHPRVGPFDVASPHGVLGRAALLEDPVGAPLHMWLNVSLHAGVDKIGWRALGTVCWHELVTDDPDRAMDFYAALLGWRARAHDAGETPYTLFLQGERRVGGLRPRTPNLPPLGCGSASCWLSYIVVDDVTRRIHRAERLGGRLVLPPSRRVGVGRYAWIADRHGAVSGMLQREDR